MSYPRYHPFFLNLKDRPVVIVGGGTVALEKLHSLLPSGASIRVISAEAAPEIQTWHSEGTLKWQQRTFSDEDVLDAFVVIAATDDPALNKRVFEAAEHHHRLANSVDDPDNCNFIMAAIAANGPLQVAVSSSGCSPAMAQRVRDRIKQEMLSDSAAALTELLGTWRNAVKASLPTYRARKAFWEAVLDSDVPQILEREGIDAASREIARLLSDPRGQAQPSRVGRVFLVGAGPGNPELLTLKGKRILESAEVVLYDRLANPELLKFAPNSAVLIDVGKAPGDKGNPRQETIHALMIEHARRGHNVVRLKGGDPFVFGRGGEEVGALREAGIECEVVPGISSAIAVPAAAGIPVTHRGLSTGFAVFTAHGAGAEDTVPWDAAAQIPTLVLLMGVERLSTVVERLRKAGRAADAPAAVISNGTLENQKVVFGTLETIAMKAEGLTAPATLVVGDVVGLSSRCRPSWWRNAGHASAV